MAPQMPQKTGRCGGCLGILTCDGEAEHATEICSKVQARLQALVRLGVRLPMALVNVLRARFKFGRVGTQILPHL